MELYLKVRRAYFHQGLSKRSIARTFGISRDSVDKMIVYSVPPGYRRVAPIKRPKLDGFTDLIDQWLQEDVGRPRKQRHTAKRVFDRLRDEHGFAGGYTIVKTYVREHQRRSREMFVPLHHPPGHGQADFGEALVVIGGRIIYGLVVLAIGLFLANLAFKLISMPGTRQSKLLAQAARICILVLVTAMGIEQMGIATNIINLAFGLLTGAMSCG